MDAEERTPLGSEGFIVRIGTVSGYRTIAADGNPPVPDGYGIGVNIVFSAGAYALLEELRFSFLHPLEPVPPRTLGLGTKRVDLAEKAY